MTNANHTSLLNAFDTATTMGLTAFDSSPITAGVLRVWGTREECEAFRASLGGEFSSSLAKIRGGQGHLVRVSLPAYRTAQVSRTQTRQVGR